MNIESEFELKNNSASKNSSGNIDVRNLAS